VNELLEFKTEKVLLISMLSSPEVCAIGLPVLRYFQKNNPQAEIHFLTFGDGADLIKLAEPRVQVKHLTQQQWPDDFFLAMELFLGSAEEIIGESYSQIINLDTHFMPCFLASFLADAAEPVSGNCLNMSIQQLLQQVQDKSLQAEYVNSPQAFMASSFVNMHKCHGYWKQLDTKYEGGYPEFYLNKCCGLDDDKLNQTIIVSGDKQLAKKGKANKVIGLCFGQSDDGYLYPYASRLKNLLEQKGFLVWTEQDAKADIRSLLKTLSASDLMVTKPSGDGDPATLMPEFDTDTAMPYAQHGADAQLIHSQALPCNCDKPENLLESIESIFVHLEEQNHA
jgi:ADP-heptose:LPS heptosyltransferase